MGTLAHCKRLHCAPHNTRLTFVGARAHTAASAAHTLRCLGIREFHAVPAPAMRPHASRGCQCLQKGSRPAASHVGVCCAPQLEVAAARAARATVPRGVAPRGAGRPARRARCRAAMTQTRTTPNRRGRGRPRCVILRAALAWIRLTRARPRGHALSPAGLPVLAKLLHPCFLTHS